jgi:signal transduction histidine kinase
MSDARVPILDAVRRLSSDLGASATYSDVASAVQRWAGSMLGDAIATVSRPDRTGRLRPTVLVGDVRRGRKRSARRRSAFELGRPTTIDVAPGRCLAILPIAAGDRAGGVLEVEAGASAISTTWVALETGAALVGAAVDRISRERRLRQRLDSMVRTARLGRDLGRVHGQRAAVRIVARFLSDAFAVPVAAWYDGDGYAATLVHVSGLGARKRRALRQALPVLPWKDLRRDAREGALRTFSEVVESRDFAHHDISGARFLIVDPDQHVEAAFEVIRPLLEHTLRSLRTQHDVEERQAALSAGAAWAAHEIRGPLLGLRTALTVLLGTPRDEDGASIIRRSIEEIDHLAALSDSVLTSTVDGRGRARGPTDIVPLIRQAADAIELETGETRIVVFAPQQASALADPLYLRTALDNLLRNAIAYSEPGTKVVVELETLVDQVELRIGNEASTVRPDEIRLLFTPFVRGIAGGRSPERPHGPEGSRRATPRSPGSGLGLFIASQAVRAQGGRLWAEAEGHGIVFHISLEIDREGALRSAS